MTNPDDAWAEPLTDEEMAQMQAIAKLGVSVALGRARDMMDHGMLPANALVFARALEFVGHPGTICVVTMVASPN